ncbi:hypothetical protein ACFQV8_03300 [Pseudonocardia benzenivorans]
MLDEAERAALGAELGAAASGIEFLDPADVYRVPAFTVAVRWARLSRRAEPGARATVVGQHVALPGGDGPGYWARLDAALDVALAGLPVEVLCPFPDGDDVLSRTTHRTLLSGGHLRPHGRVPRAAGGRRRVPLRHLPTWVSPGSCCRSVWRASAGCAAPSRPWPPTGAPDRTGRRLRAGRQRDRQQQRRARARLGDPADVGHRRPGRRRGARRGPAAGAVPWAGGPAADGARGRGLWLASELSDVLQVWSDAGAPSFG